MKTKKVYCSIFLSLLLTLSLNGALSEKYVSIQELNSLTQDNLVWNNVYKTGKREVDVNIPIIIPKAIGVPVLEVKPWMPDLVERLNAGLISDDGWYGYCKKYADIGLKSLFQSDDSASFPMLCVSDKDSPLTEQSISVKYNDPLDLRINARGGDDIGYPNLTMYPWEYQTAESVYAEENTSSLKDALCCLDAMLKYYYTSDDDSPIFIDYVEIRGRLRKLDAKTGVLGTVYDSYPSGTYYIHYFQNIQEIPLLLSSFSMYDYYTLEDSKVDTERFNSITDLQNSAEIMVPYHSLMLRNCFVKTISTLENDIPLAPIEVIKSNIERQIEKGYIRKVYSLRLGYVCFLNNASPSSFTLYPMWVLECDYASSPDEEIRVNPYSDGFREGVGFTKLCFNAQSGEMIDRMKCTKKSLECPPITTWEDVK